MTSFVTTRTLTVSGTHVSAAVDGPGGSQPKQFHNVFFFVGASRSVNSPAPLSGRHAAVGRPWQGCRHVIWEKRREGGTERHS